MSLFLYLISCFVVVVYDELLFLLLLLLSPPYEIDHRLVVVSYQFFSVVHLSCLVGPVACFVGPLLISFNVVSCDG